MAQGESQNWTTAYETLPDGTDSPEQGDDELRNLKASVRARLAHEHRMDLATDSATADAGWHKLGSAVIYYGSSEPTTRPDGNTALDADDAGRMWLNSDTGELWFYTGSVWSQDYDLVLTDLTASGTVTCDGDLIIPRRTSDPSSPVVGQMWLRTDL